MVENDTRQRAGHEPGRWWETSDVEIEEVGGIRVAHLPAADDAWISGWVDVPR